MKILLTLLTLVATFLGVAFFFPDYIGSSQYVDFTPPEMTLEQNGGELTFTVSDNLSGITSVRYLVQQNGETRVEQEILQERVNLQKNHQLSLNLRSLRASLKEGNAEIIVTAQDGAVWNNVVRMTTPVTLDFSSPSIEVLSIQHRMFAGGAELVLFQATDNSSLQDVWLSVYRDKTFAPFQLSLAYPNLDIPKNLYGVLFATPRGLARDEFRPKLHALDSFGNTTEVPLSLRFEEQSLRKTTPKLSREFLARKIPPLILEMKDDGYLPPQSVPGDVEGFQLINEQYRDKLGEELKAAMEREGVRPTLPKNHFQRPMAGSLTSRFGEFRTYTFEGKDVSTSHHDGQDIASVLADKVVATSAGKVLLADQLGIYGKTVLLDHGAGITSLYGHLSSLAVEAGQMVEQGELIGRSGTTGLAGGDHLHFEIRVQGVPVTPIEWWDAKWFKDNIELKLTNLLQLHTLN